MSKTETTRPYKMADAIFIVMEKLGLDPIKDVRAHYALEEVLKASWNAAIESAYNQIYPKNDKSDWTDYAHDTARIASRLTELKK